MRLAIVGGRDFQDYTRLTIVCNRLVFDTVVSGGAKGADSLAEKYAWEYKKKLCVFLPDWDKYGRRAGFVRNEEIVLNADGVLAFWNGTSRGTQNTISLAQKYGKPLKVIQY
jgi:hypothetical protein